MSTKIVKWTMKKLLKRNHCNQLYDTELNWNWFTNKQVIFSYFQSQCSHWSVLKHCIQYSHNNDMVCSTNCSTSCRTESNITLSTIQANCYWKQKNGKTDASAPDPVRLGRHNTMLCFEKLTKLAIYCKYLATVGTYSH